MGSRVHRVTSFTWSLQTDGRVSANPSPPPPASTAIDPGYGRDPKMFYWLTETVTAVG